VDSRLCEAKCIAYWLCM